MRPRLEDLAAVLAHRVAELTGPQHARAPLPELIARADRPLTEVRLQRLVALEVGPGFAAGSRGAAGPGGGTGGTGGTGGGLGGGTVVTGNVVTSFPAPRCCCPPTGAWTNASAEASWYVWIPGEAGTASMAGSFVTSNTSGMTQVPDGGSDRPLVRRQPQLAERRVDERDGEGRDEKPAAVDRDRGRGRDREDAGVGSGAARSGRGDRPARRDQRRRLPRLGRGRWRERRSLRWMSSTCSSA